MVGGQVDGGQRVSVERNLLAPTIDFLRRHAPFDRMTGPHLEFLAKQLRLGFYPKGEIITETARGVARTLYIIKQGRVRGEMQSGRSPTQGEVWELEAGESFPIGAMLARRPVIMKHRAVEDTFCFELDRDGFEKLLGLSPVFLDFCTHRLANLLTEALRGIQADLALQSSDASFSAPLAHLVRRSPVTCSANTPLQQAVGRMHAERVGSIVIVDAAEKPIGIFTLHDLLDRVAAKNVSLATEVAKVMTSSPVVISAQATAHEATVVMTQRSIGHLCVIENGRLVGVVSERDLFSLQRIGLVHLTRAVTHAPDIQTLARLRGDMRRLIQHIMVQGASVVQLMQIIAALNDHVTRRVIALCIAEHGDPGIPFVWLAFGSEGREEQTLKTDQDNGMLFEAASGQSADAVRDKLLPLARRINDALAACGFPLCKGNVMASNPECCLSFDEWRERFAKWIDHGAPEHLLQASIYFDVRALTGDATRVDALRRFVHERVAATPRFLHQLALNALRNEPPLGLFRDFDVESDGAHADMINLKLRGATPFVDGARLLALAHGVSETNTLARLRALSRQASVPEVEAQAWCDAYAFIQLLRMRRNQEQERAGQPLDNYLDPQRLNDLDRRVLKEAFRQARKLQSLVALEYRV